MMRELDTVSPVVWPAWCYTGEGTGGDESDSPVVQVSTARSRAKRRPTTVMPQAAAAETNNNTSTAANNNSGGGGSVKNERLSPASASAQQDKDSASSRSATPSSGHYPDTSPGQRSSYPDTPPAQSPGSSPGLMNRNYSDMMRSLAAKYNNNNPNDYFSSARNGSNFPLDSRFGSFKAGTPPFVGLMAPLATTTISPASTAASQGGKSSSNSGGGKDSAETPLTKSQQALYASIANPFAAAAAGNPMFPPLIDMSSTQALLNMVRTASAHAHNATQLETYLKGAIKRPAPSESSPLDLSPASLPATKKPRKSLSETSFENFLNIPIVDTLRTSKGLKRTGSVSPSRGGSNASSPRLGHAPLSASSAPLIGGRCMSLCKDAQSIAHWTTDDVCNYVTSIEACAEYAQNFRAERIDGSTLPLLSEDHLTNTMGMKLGPALKLKIALSRRLGNCVICSHCVHCHTPADQPSTSQAGCDN